LKKPTKGPARVELPPQQQRGLSFFSATTWRTQKNRNPWNFWK
jgi:hypothetical protein